MSLNDIKTAVYIVVIVSFCFLNKNSKTFPRKILTQSEACPTIQSLSSHSHNNLLKHYRSQLNQLV